MSAVLAARGVSIAFGGVQALLDVSLEVAPSSIVALIGPNGAGKTTLFNCLTGVYRPDRGEVEIQGRSIAGMPPDRITALGVARTFQNIELFSHMSVLDNVLLGRHRHMKTGALSGMLFLPRVEREEVAQRGKVEELLDFLDLQSARTRMVAELPYGVRKRVELARALACEPRVLLLDEPSAGMNAEEKQELCCIIEDIRSDLNVSVLLVEHDMGLVMGISERVIVLDHGAKIAEGTSAEVARDPEVIRAYLGGSA